MDENRQTERPLQNTFLWRPVTTQNANQLAFETGGEKFRVALGLFQLSCGVLLVYFAFPFIPKMVQEVRSFLQAKEYHAAIMDYIGTGSLFLFPVCFVFQGVWCILGRESVVADKSTGTIHKRYRVLSFAYHEKVYHVEAIASLSFGRSKGIWRPFGSYSCFLNNKIQKRIQFLVFHSKMKDGGRAMSEQIAIFLGLKLESEWAVRKQASDAKAS